MTLTADTDGRGRSRAPLIFISAGEPSGDLHGAGLARALRERIPGVRLIGLGGARMVAEGVELLATVEDLAVMGFAEVAARLPFFVKLRRRVFSVVERERVDLVIPIDYPGFNLRLARFAHDRGVKVLYYIAPQVWAWHASRAADLARDTDEVAVILPFEEEFLRKAGASAKFVGHPLLDLPAPSRPREEVLRGWGLDPQRPVLALFPGSRPQEVRRHLDLFNAAAAAVQRERPEVQPIIGASPDLDREVFAGARWPLADDPRALLHHTTAALVKSGTTTLEAALAETPFVVAYRMNPLSYRIARRLVKVPHIALANLVAEERLAPELVQEAATPETLRDAALPLLDLHSSERQRMVEGLRRVRARLGGEGAARRVAEDAAALLGR
ncbi:MAG TPA: lipid-A-disaccharide synthase [Longimicrobiaceae bacterium]